jgi:uncharacterized protein (UPF0276 family)
MLPAIGYALLEHNPCSLDDAAINAAEVAIDGHGRPLKSNKELRNAGLDVISLHRTCGKRPGHAEPVTALRSLADQSGAASISDSISSLNSAAACNGAAPVYSLDRVDSVARDVEVIQRELGPLRFYLQNIACQARPVGDLSEADFLGKILQKTGCGWLLDIASIYANGRNFGYDPYDVIAEVLPVAMHVQLRLSCGYFDAHTRMFIASRKHPVPEELWSLYRHALVLGGHKTDAVFIELRQAGKDSLNDVRHARFVAERVHGRQRMLRHREASLRSYQT